MIVLDTNVISELLLPVPERSVVDWLAEHRKTPQHSSAIL